jgi:hypothetical protein
MSKSPTVGGGGGVGVAAIYCGFYWKVDFIAAYIHPFQISRIGFLLPTTPESRYPCLNQRHPVLPKQMAMVKNRELKTFRK